jgi:hypothetical protein
MRYTEATSLVYRSSGFTYLELAPLRCGTEGFLRQSCEHPVEGAVRNVRKDEEKQLVAIGGQPTGAHGGRRGFGEVVPWGVEQRK